MEYEIVIGLEVHVQLKTKTKAFCGCSAEFGAKPNSQTCPVCLGFPGALPVLNKIVLDYAIKVGLALGCQVRKFTKFDRKHYYYPDLPKNFQISQFDLPVSIDGFLDIEVEGKPKRIRIKRAHLEEDAGKLIHAEAASHVDLNRTGVPLLEIVSEPDMFSPEEAHAYLTALKTIIQYLGVSDCDMEKGSLRCDANISLKPKGSVQLGTKAELKNMNSFSGVKDALAYEALKQEQILKEGGVILQETLLWDPKEKKTLVMRTKEEAKDYRYFPEPDLPPFIISNEKIEEIRKTIPELPKEKALRFMKEYGLSDYDASILVSTREDAQFAEVCLKAYQGANKKLVSNWLIGAVLSEANSRNLQIADLALAPEGLIELISFVEKNEISHLTAKQVLKDMIDTNSGAAEIIKTKNLAQISDTGALETAIDEILKENPASVEAVKSGKANAVMFLVGQVMKKTQGKANPKLVQDMLKRRFS